jgi:acyl carrier protein
MRSVFDSYLLRAALAIERATGLDAATISPGTGLVDDLELGRLDRLRLAVCLEEAFGLELSDDVLKRFVTVADIARYFSHHCFTDHEFPLPLVTFTPPIASDCRAGPLGGPS